MNGICYIVGSGEFTSRDLNPHPNDLVIAADGGYRYLEKAGIKSRESKSPTSKLILIPAF